MIAALLLAQVTTCQQFGTIVQCSTPPSAPAPVQSDPNAMLGVLLGTVGRQRDTLRQAQSDAMQRRLNEQQLEIQRQQIQLQQMQIDAARRSAEAAYSAPAPVAVTPSARPYPVPTTPPLARAVVDRHVAEGDCKGALTFARQHGDPDLAAYARVVCPAK